MAAGGTDDLRRFRILAWAAGGVYLFWWFTVELLLPGSFNPFPGRLGVVALDAALLLASYRSRWIARNLSALFTVWLSVLVAHYFYLLIGNRGDSTWWVGAFVTLAATSMCPESRREVLLFSLFALVCAVFAAALEGQASNSIYVPGLATILLLANVTKRSQIIAQDATLQRLQLAAIVESSGDAIIATGLDGTIRSWNIGAERLFGYTAEEAVGKPISLLLVPGRQGEEPALFERLSKGEPVAPYETLRRRKDGSVVDVSVTLSPIVGSGGELVGASKSARDVSDRKRAQAEAVRAREIAEAANKELESFSYSVAHDLRAPLRGIDGFSLALLEQHRNALDSEGQDYLRRVREATQKMGRLIDGLLAISRVTRAGIKRQDVDLSAIARVAADRLRESDADRNVEFVIQAGLRERGDSVLLGAVIENLVDNAWKFTRNRPNARIEFGSAKQNGETVYFLRDNGAGFDMAYASRLFGVFQRLHTHEEFEGTGIGLATVQRIVHRHGGRVWAEGKIGEGACFQFTVGSSEASNADLVGVR